MKRIVLTLAASLMLAACGGSTSSDTTTAVPAAEPAPPKPWEPTPFDPTSETAALNDLGEFYAGFKSNADAQAKGEFETTPQYEERMSDLSSALGPFSSEAVYALTPQQYYPFTYNADRQVFHPRSGNTYCIDLEFKYTHKGVECRIGEVVDVQRDFEGRNAFGTSARVSSEEGRELYLLLPSRSKAFSDKRDPTFKYMLGICPVPLEQAKTLSGQVDMAYLVRLTGSEMVYGGTEYKDATVASPIERRLERQGLPVDVVGFVCYNTRNSAVLHQEMF